MSRDAIHRARMSLAQSMSSPEAFTRLIDKVITSLWTGPTVGVALCAQGGYGRGVMAPFSDVDLLVVVGGDHDVSAHVEHLVQQAYDLRLAPSWATRTIDECLDLARTDLPSATSLFDLRCLHGDEELVGRLNDRFLNECVRPARADWLEWLRQERKQRRARFGDTVFMLEPDLKAGEGGLRDLQSLRWVARVCDAPEDGSTLGLSDDDVRRIGEAETLLMRYRASLHGCSRRKTDRLSFELQDALTEALGERSVKVAMQRYWQAARAVATLSRRALDAARDQVGMEIGPRVRATADVDTTAVTDWYVESSRLDAPLHPETQRLVSLAIPRVNAATRRHRRTRDAFFEVLCAADSGRSLRAMHDQGWLSALVPEFRALTGLYQRNVFHVYTVDVHTLHGISALKALAVPALRPVATANTSLPALYASLSDLERWTLHLAMLLHDLDKGGVDPALSYAVAERMGLPDRTCQQVEHLVREHLLMALLSQTRDVHDSTTHLHLAREAGDRRTLALLYLVTYADMSSANPGLLTDWKRSLLETLYQRTDALIAGGLDVFDDRSRLVKRQREAALVELLGSLPEHPTAATRAVDGFVARLPTRYFAVVEPDELLKHVELAKAVDAARRSNEDAPAATYWDDERNRLSIVCPDTEELLARLTGTLAAYGHRILSAEVFALGDDLALDVFDLDPERFEYFDESLLTAMNSASTGAWPAERLARLEAPSPLGRRPEPPPVELQVGVDDQASRRYTVIDVVCQDRPGLLHRVSFVLSALRLSIRLAFASTEGHIARQAFYLERAGGGKLINDDERRRVLATLVEVLS